MAELETVTGSGPDPSAVGWVGRWMQSDLHPPGSVGGAVTRSDDGTASTGLKTTATGVGPVTFGQYELLERLGQGGMGTVYRVRNRELDRHEAMKLIARNADDSAARSRFEREFLSLAKIEHPHIVPVYAAGSWDGVPYFTMKYVPGGPLSKHLDRFRADPVAAARLMAKVARAVGKLHAAGVLHRDLKPHNILLGDGDEPLVADFGLVKRLGEDSDASHTGFPMGTRQYMSPEQTFAHRVDYTPACDIWAVGVILYELLAGARPFPSADPVEVYLQIRAAKPRPILAANPAAPPALAAIAHRCLAKAPSDRYPSASAVADDLEAWLAGDTPTVTHLPPPNHRARTRVAVLGLVAAGCLAGGLLAAGLWANPPHRPDAARPPAEGPIGKRLEAGETVELVGPTGPPRVATQPVGTSGGLLSDNADQPCRFTSFQFGMLDLVTEEVPRPFRLEAELAHRSGTPDTFVGVYVGRRPWAGDQVYESAVACTVVRKDGPQGERNQVAVTNTVWCPPGGLMPARGKLTWAAFPGAPAAPKEVHWRKLAVTVAPGSVRVAWDGLPEQEYSEARLADALHGASARRDLVPAGGPVLGPGVGLIVGAAEGSFRNVRLVPVPPQNP